MGLTITPISRNKFGRRIQALQTVTFDSSYPTGGESLTAQMLGLTVIDTIAAEPIDGYQFEYDRTNSKLKAFRGAIRNLLLTHAGIDMKGGANTDSANADVASVPVNGGLILNAVAVAAGAWVSGALTLQPDIGRNVCVVINNPSGGPLNLYEGASIFTMTGTWRGVAQTETITFTSTAGNKAVAAGKCRVMYGVKPFSTIATITIGANAQCPNNAMTISMGIGAKIGLPGGLANGLAGDVIKATVSSANLVLTSAVNITYDTVNTGTTADNADFVIVYKAAGEVTDASTLATLATRVTAVGY